MGLSVLFLTYFGTDMKTKMGVVICMYLKHSSYYIDSIYIWVHGSNLGSIFFDEIPFLAFFSRTPGKEKVWSGGTQHMLLPE